MSSVTEVSPLAELRASSLMGVSFAFATSVMIHLSVLGVLAVFVMPGRSGETTGSRIDAFLIDTTLAEAGESGSFGNETLVLAEFESASPESPQPESLHELSATPMESLIPAELAELPGLPLLDDSELAAVSMSDQISSGTEVGVGSGMGNRSGSGRGKGKGAGSGTGSGNSGEGKGGAPRGKGGFFGLKVKGQSTVFVVDGSRSMNQPHPGRSRTRFNRVKRELVQAINSLTEDEKFFIMFFADGAFPMPADRMMEGTPQAKRRYLNWMSACQATGQTYPEQALQLALQLEPDQIYFLTDGEFNYSVIPTVTAANQTGISIHCIGFSDNRGENFLLELARRNNGTYTYIPADDPDDDEDGDAGASAMSILSPLGK